MSTWKSKVVHTRFDLDIDVIDAKMWWEYQTTADVFSFHTTSEQDYQGYVPIKKGDNLAAFHLGRDQAIDMYHALGSWIGRYFSEEKALDAINKNVFESLPNV